MKQNMNKRCVDLLIAFASSQPSRPHCTICESLKRQWMSGRSLRHWPQPRLLDRYTCIALVL